VAHHCRPAIRIGFTLSLQLESLPRKLCTRLHAKLAEDLAIAEIPLVSFALAHEATRARLDQFYGWISTTSGSS
jgi:hypothetical protein